MAASLHGALDILAPVAEGFQIGSAQDALFVLGAPFWESDAMTARKVRRQGLSPKVTY